MGLVPLLLAYTAWDLSLYYWLPLQGTSPSTTGFHFMKLLPVLLVFIA
jgi:hypothetical protein